MRAVRARRAVRAVRAMRAVRAVRAVRAMRAVRARRAMRLRRMRAAPDGEATAKPEAEERWSEAGREATCHVRRSEEAPGGTWAHTVEPGAGLLVHS